MRTFTLILFTTILLTKSSYGQKELLELKKIYQIADSLIANGQISALDTTALFAKVQNLDQEYPSGYFLSSAQYMSNHQFNEASFCYFLGLMRFRYYNSASPDYSVSNDGALLASFKAVWGEPIGMYLCTDIDNYIFILKLSVSYYSKNDYTFFSKKKSKSKFKVQIEQFNDLISDLESNKERYMQQWAAERKTKEEQIDKAMEYYKTKEVKE